MIGIAEPVRFVANSLKQMQRTRIHRQLQRHRPTGPIDFFVFLCQSDDWQIVQTKPLQFPASRRKLPLTAIDDYQVWQADGDELWLVDCGLRVDLGFKAASSFELIFLGMLRR